MTESKWPTYPGHDSTPPPEAPQHPIPTAALIAAGVALFALAVGVVVLAPMKFTVRLAAFPMLGGAYCFYPVLMRRGERKRAELTPSTPASTDPGFPAPAATLGHRQPRGEKPNPLLFVGGVLVTASASTGIALGVATHAWGFLVLTSVLLLVGIAFLAWFATAYRAWTTPAD